MLASARALVDEFNSLIGPQKAALSARLPQLFQQYYAPPPELLSAPVAGGALPGTVNGSSHHAAASKVPKRGAGEPMQPQDSKRLKQQPSGAQGAGGDLDRRQEALFKEVLNLLAKKLLTKKEALAFKEPVDPIKLKIPDYFQFVKNPMDLGTVRTRLSNKEYKTPMDACADVRLVWRNCAHYNPIGHPVRKQGDQLADIWEKAWHESRIEEKWAELMLEKEPTVAHRVAQLNSQLKSAVSLIPPGSVAPAPSGTMSDLDKRRLSIQLADLQGEHMNGLLMLIQDDLPAPAGGSTDDEVELDLDALPVSTLFKMQAYVNSMAAGRSNVVIMAPPSKAAPAAGMAGQAGAQQHHHHHAHAAQAAAPGAAPGAGAGAGLPPAGTAAAAAPAGAQPANSQQAPEQEDDTTGGAASSGQASPTGGSGDSAEVRDSTADDPNAGKGGAFVWNTNRPPGGGAGAAGVDESATAPHATSSILKDRNAARKPELQVNADNWDVAALQGGADGQEEPEEGGGGVEEDEVWKNFQSREEQKRQQAEEQRKLREQQESELRKIKDAEQEEARRAATEAEERERALAAEEERIQAEQQRARMEQCDKEVDEIKARQGTANLVQNDNMQSLVQAQPNEGDLAAVGLTFRNDDDDVNFDEE